MLTLGSRNVEFKNFGAGHDSEHLLLSSNSSLPRALRQTRTYIIRDIAPIPDGFSAYIGFDDRVDLLATLPKSARSLVATAEYNYLSDGDIVRVVPGANLMRTFYRKGSRQNFFLTTERCNNYCLMCSQPPKTADDSWLVEDILRGIPLIDRSTPEITLTGGEPTLLGDGFFRIIASCKSWLPETAIHVLSNGRTFSQIRLAKKVAALSHPDIMIGIPLYSDISNLHDYVVQADGAFDETIRGILNLKRVGQRVEIRVVLHKQTYQRLPMLAEFIARNLRFVDQVVFMGLEMTGFTRANLADLWIDPVNYQSELQLAVEHLAAHRVRVAIYNHQLCVLPESLWPYATKSISDWKNEYMPECNGCKKMSDCGGFFSSAKLLYSDHIKPFRSGSAEIQE